MGGAGVILVNLVRLSTYFKVISLAPAHLCVLALKAGSSKEVC